MITQQRHTTSSQTRGKVHGFTLIELLVVIAIIAILAAILFPVFAKARAKARQSACLSNMKQIGLAVLQYNQDFDELEPYDAMDDHPVGAGGSATWWVAWPDLVYPYVQSEKVFECPDADAKIQAFKHFANRKSSACCQYWTGTYAANSAYRNPSAAYHSPVAHFDSTKPSLVPNTAVSKIVTPASTVFALDGGQYISSSNSWDYAAQASFFWWDNNSGDPVVGNCHDVPCMSFGTQTVTAYPPARHNDMINIIWCDGHVKSMAITDLLVRNSASLPLKYFNIEAQ